jgi:hypothetical protein
MASKESGKDLCIKSYSQIEHSFDLFFREYIGSSSLQKARKHADIRFYGSQEAGNPRPLQECKQGFVEEFRVSCCEGQPYGAFSTLLLQALLFSSCVAAAALTPSLLCILVLCAMFIHPCKQTSM